MVLVPGLGMSADYLRPVADALVTYCNVFILELPGVGKSERPDRRLTVADHADLLSEWTAATGVRRPLLAGNSFGSQVVADFAARYPQFTFGVVLLDPVMDPQHRSAPAQLSRFVRNAFREPLSLWRLASRDYLRSGPKALRQMFKSSIEDEIERKLPSIAVPILVVRGENDVLTTHEWAETAAALAPDGRLVEVDGAAHASMYAQGAEVAQVIRTFADSIRPTSPAAARHPRRRRNAD